jgi:YHS domain-containing protein
VARPPRILPCSILTARASRAHRHGGLIGDSSSSHARARTWHSITQFQGDDMADNEQLVTDPVCQMKIKPADAVTSIEHAGTVYYFCSQDCADSFKESPEDYL